MRTAQIFGMQHCLVDIYQVCSNYVPWAKIGHSPGFSQFTLIYIGKHKKSFFSETNGTRPWIFGDEYCVETLYQYCLNVGPGVKLFPWGQNWPRRRGHFILHRLTQEIFKNVLLRNHNAYSLDIWYVALSSGCLPCLFKLCSLGQNWPRPRVLLVYIDLCRKT